MQCVAQKDGLMGTTYIHAGETFEAEKCPGWATAVDADVVKPAAKPKAGGKAPEKGE